MSIYTQLDYDETHKSIMSLSAFHALEAARYQLTARTFQIYPSTALRELVIYRTGGPK